TRRTSSWTQPTRSCFLRTGRHLPIRKGSPMTATQQSRRPQSELAREPGGVRIAAQCPDCPCFRWLLAQRQAVVHRDMRAFDAGIAELDQACDFLFIDAGIGCRVACIDLFDWYAGTAQVVMRKRILA